MSKLFLTLFLLGLLLVLSEARPRRGRGRGRGRGDGQGWRRFLDRDISDDVGRGFRRWMRRDGLNAVTGAENSNATSDETSHTDEAPDNDVDDSDESAPPGRGRWRNQWRRPCRGPLCRHAERRTHRRWRFPWHERQNIDDRLTGMGGNGGPQDMDRGVTRRGRVRGRWRDVGPRIGHDNLDADTDEESELDEDRTETRPGRRRFGTRWERRRSQVGPHWERRWNRRLNRHRQRNGRRYWRRSRSMKSLFCQYVSEIGRASEFASTCDDTTSVDVDGNAELVDDGNEPVDTTLNLGGNLVV